MIIYPIGYDGPRLEDIRQETREFVSLRFKDEQGNPLILKDGQCDIYNAIALKVWPRVHIQTHTRYGKSLVIGIAVDTRISAKPEKYSIVAGTDEQAKIIQAYAIDHIFDDPEIQKKFDTQGESIENIRRYKNKNRINFVVKRGNKLRGEKDLLGESFITNAKGAMGFGAPNVILDEAALVPDDEEALVFRMTGDSAEDNFYCKVGNPWESRHFRASAEDDTYLKIIIDCYESMKEGRITQKQIDEGKKRPFFGVLFETKFPPQGMVDEQGWVPLLTRDQVKKALVQPGHPSFGVQKLGGDVAGGGRNFSVIVERRENVARIKYRQNEPDTMTVAEQLLSFYWDAVKRKDIIPRQNVSIDMVGIGKGAYDILQRQTPGIIGVNAGDKLDPKKTRDEKDKMYFNLRAKMYWKAAQWIIGGGKLELLEGENENESLWYELSKIKYKTKLEGTQGKIQIMPKETMLKEGTESPDVADAFSMTFAGIDFMPETEDDREERTGQERSTQKVDPWNPFAMGQ